MSQTVDLVHIYERMRDIRRHREKAPSGAQVSKKVKVARQALGDLSVALLSSHPDLAAQVDELDGVLVRVGKGAGVL